MKIETTCSGSPWVKVKGRGKLYPHISHDKSDQMRIHRKEVAS